MSILDETHVDGARQLAERTRELMDRVARTAPGAASARLAARIEELLAEFDDVVVPADDPWYHSLDREQRLALVRLTEGPGTNSAGTSWTSFNPVAPPLALRMDGRAARGTVQLGPVFSGPPGRVHGGTVATLIDHAMGSLLFHLAMPSYTARLEIDYRASAPLGVDLLVESSILKEEGRKTWVEATVSVDGELAARGVGLFIRMARP